MSRAIVLLLIASTVSATEPVAGLKLPPGFTIAEYAGPQLANDVYSLHIDATGRVVVTGRGYARQLIDGRAVDLVAGLQQGPMGVLWEGDTLHLVVDGGLKRYRGVDGKAPVRTAETIFAIKTGGEHDTHAVRRGADGLLYLLCGNMSGVAKRHITAPQSPITDPIAGCLVRMKSDGSQLEVLADGFRNAYDFDFDLNGDPHTFDSDNERCVGLPWYEPCRFYRVVPGGNYGWLNPQFTQTWRRPPYFPDVVAPVATLGRGSPTGVVCYRHTQFPERYRGGFFLADWTFGKVWFVAPGRKPEPFLEATGENGFAPTGLAVHPKTGELFVAIGGRGTRGSVFRIRHTDGPTDPKPLGITPKPREPLTSKPIPKPQADDLAKAPDAAAKLAVVRSWQLALGDLSASTALGTVWEGYSFRKRADTVIDPDHRQALRRAFPSGDDNLDRELSRTLAALNDRDADMVTMVAKMVSTASHPAEDVHYLIVLARLRGMRTAAVTRTTAEALLALDLKLKQRGIAPERNWYQSLTEATTALMAEDLDLADAIVSHKDFGRATHAWLARLPKIDRGKAARRFLAVSAKQRDFAWSRELVSLLAELPDTEVRPHLAAIWDHGGVEDALVPLYARNATAADRPKLLVGLRSLSAPTVKHAADALAKLPADPAELLPTVQALRRVGDGKPEAPVRESLAALLHQWTGEKHGPDAKAWEAWFVRAKPELAKQLTAVGYDAAAWAKRLADVKWDDGDRHRGAQVYRKATCAACHDGGQAAGPSLVGVGKRFGRDDLMTALLDPNRDVPARYRPTRITTDDGRTFDGMVIYEANDGVILQTGADATIRVAGARIESRRPLATSLMPAGLLDRLTDAEIADLMAYLRSLNGP